LCPLAFGLLLGWAIPKSTIYSKLPETFIHENYKKLSQSKFIFSSDPGLAVSLAWELKRNDIRLYDSHGEFAYGLRESNQSDKYLDEHDFIKWIDTARNSGDVSVVTLHNLDEQLNLPKADEEITKHRLSLFYYSSHMNK
jgi:4-amino-4-deoxy-L-arabinose transferase